MNLKDPKTQKIVFGVVILAAAGWVYFGTTLMPFNYPVRKAKIAALEAEHERLAAEVEKARRVVGDLARLEAEYERLHDQWLAAQELLPEEKEMPDLLRAVTTAGSRAGVEFALFQPKPPVAAEFHTAHPIQVTVRGTYHQVGSFLGRLANMERIVNVTDLKLDQPKESSNKRKKTSTSKKKDSEQPARNMVARSNNTVEAQFVLTAYTLTGGVSDESVNEQHARND
ncbi:MAG: type 4a pilus biogenesis protein PilO [Candidatus Krumholzibacteria bacterium]|nr:type 4a pilus biogenesis protein PilO [Candidatus Krumholzibacteria bacterium]MDH4338307.1 type 4a pilus biogenesis protein PilO [Candidatus Krumholzibacteria bacterium]MDH5268940.1 type 4a pilus biogenesis protein PilO [Candidatus Krumholzibacteria bacterium]MDH5627185.1 type 4a pilus biogenesis protein PilO [Candidatus Krumholzibacteria bacterium]